MLAFINRYWPVICAAVVGFVIVAGAYAYTQDKQLEYVRGQHGDICYLRDFANKNIKYPLYFRTIDECVASLKGQK